MHIGRYGSTIGVCLGLVAAGLGMIWPNNPTIGWTLVAAGVVIFLVSSLWWLVSYFGSKKRAQRTSDDPATIGDINVKAGNRNQFGNIGHRVSRSRDGTRQR
jgi:hypothetical protein